MTINQRDHILSRILNLVLRPISGDNKPSDRRVRRAIDRTVAAAMDQQKKGAWKEAAANYQIALELDDAQPAIWVQLGHVSKEHGDTDTAKTAYQKAARIEPENAETHLHLGHLLKNMDLSKEAGAAFVQCLKHGIHWHDAYDQLLHLGWTRNDILAAVPLLGMRRAASDEAEQGVCEEAVFEAVVQMIAIGNRPRKPFVQGH